MAVQPWINKTKNVGSQAKLSRAGNSEHIITHCPIALCSCSREINTVTSA